MTHDRNDPFEYDVALSFAAEDRPTAEEFAQLLRARSIRVFLEEYQSVELGGGDFLIHLAELYRTKALYCVMLLSQHYPLKRWMESEQTSVQNHALRDSNEYILPFQLDNTAVPGVTESKGYRDLRQDSFENVVKFLENRLNESEDSSGPPAQSHDLRSGNVPSTEPSPSDE